MAPWFSQEDPMAQVQSFPRKMIYCKAKKRRRWKDQEIFREAQQHKENLKSNHKLGMLVPESYLISCGVINIHWDPCANAKSTRVSRLIFLLTASWSLKHIDLSASQDTNKNYKIHPQTVGNRLKTRTQKRNQCVCVIHPQIIDHMDPAEKLI